MKTVMQLLSLLLCFEFIVAPVQGSLFISSAMADETKTCPAGQKYESSVNRCLTKTEVLKVNEATQSCGNDKACYEQNAQTALAEQGDTYGGKNLNSSGLAKAGTAVAVAIPLVIVTSVLLEKRDESTDETGKKTGKGGSGKGFTCNPPSLLLMYGAAAALGVGEIYGYFNHKSKLKKIQEKWDSSVVPKEESGTDKKRTEATEAQSQAFEFLAQNEEQVGKTAKMKKGFYLAATGLFAAGAIAATVEMFQLKAAQAKMLLPIATPTTPGITLAEREQAIKTVNRLSCYQDNSAKDKNAAARNKTRDDAKSKELSDKKQAELEANAEKAAKQANGATPNSKILYQETQTVDGGKIIIDNRNVKPQTPAATPATTPNTSPAIDGSIEGLDNSCGPEGCGNFQPKENLEKLKRVAAYNLSTAKDADQFLNLMKEYESIEFENYSLVRYVEEEKVNKDVKFSPYIAKMIAEVLIPSSHAQGGGLMNLAGGMAMPLLGGMKGILNILKFNNGKPISIEEMDAVKDKSSNFVIRAIGKPVTRLAINGVLGGWMGLMTGHMSKQQKLAEQRAKKLRSIKEDFVSANGLLYCTEEDRSDTTKPKCYCYTPENKVNPSRSSSEVCKNALATIKKDDAEDAPEKVCVTTSMAMDSACACRSTNTCLKTSAGFTSMGFSPATFRMISANSGAANDLFNGNASGADIADSAGINAARTQAAAANAIAGDKAAVKEAKNAADAFEKGLLATTSGLSMGSGSSNSPLPTTPAAAAAALDKEIKDNNSDIDVTDSGTSSSSSASFGSTEEVPEFGMSSGDAANQEIEIAEVMGKEVDFGSNDINKTKDTNLFEVLSNRYKRSGMKRLFEEGKSAPADAPAKSDIAE